MRLIYLCCIAFLFLNFVLVDDFIEVGISYGYGSYGSTAVKFEREGLLYRYDIYDLNSNKNSYTEISHFIPLSELNGKKVQALQTFLHKKDMFNLNYSGYADSILTSRKCVSINLRSPQGKCKSYCYRSCNSELDSVIILLNNLLPKKVNKSVIIPPICD